jgi:hypothetical protein
VELAVEAELLGTLHARHDLQESSVRSDVGRMHGREILHEKRVLAHHHVRGRRWSIRWFASCCGEGRMTVTSEPERKREIANSAGAPEHVSVVEAYAGDAADELPVGGYLALMAVFLAAFGSVAGRARARHRLEESLSARDIVLAGIAVHKLSRTVARERVTLPLRMPFTQYAGSGGAGQVREKPRGRGLQRALGNLLTCQYCTAPWSALLVTTGLVFAPRTTRLANSMLAMTTLSDFLHQAYAATRRWSA